MPFAMPTDVRVTAIPFQSSQQRRDPLANTSTATHLRSEALTPAFGRVVPSEDAPADE